MIYLDSCIVIYAAESLDLPGEQARERIAHAAEQVAISALVVHEALVAPLRSRDAAAIARMQSFLATFTFVDLGIAEFVRAAELRAATRGLRTPDALHLAAAQLSGCTQLWTNDKRLTAASAGLAVDVIGADA